MFYNNIRIKVRRKINVTDSDILVSKFGRMFVAEIY